MTSSTSALTDSLPNIKTIYFDQDDVLAGFDAYVKERTGKSCREMGNEAVDMFMIEHVPKGLFMNLPEMPDFEKMRDLMHHLSKRGYNVEILTAVGDPAVGKDAVTAARDKRDWLKKRGLENYSFNWVHTGIQKARFAKPTTLLIDDFDRNIRPFREQGGHGIVHTHYDSTIQQLEFYVDLS